MSENVKDYTDDLTALRARYDILAENARKEYESASVNGGVNRQQHAGIRKSCYESMAEAIDAILNQESE